MCAATLQPKKVVAASSSEDEEAEDEDEGDEEEQGSGTANPVVDDGLFSDRDIAKVHSSHVYLYIHNLCLYIYQHIHLH